MPSRYPHPPHTEGLCLGLLVAPLFRWGFFCGSHCTSMPKPYLFLLALPLPLQAKNRPAIWKFQLVSTPLQIFPSSSSTVQSMVPCWRLSLAPTELNTPQSSRWKNSSTCLILLNSQERLSLSPS